MPQQWPSQHEVPRTLDADPFGIETGSSCSFNDCFRDIRVSPAIRRAVHYPQWATLPRSNFRPRRPPWSQCNDAYDGRITRQGSGYPSTHRMSEQNDLRVRVSRLDRIEHVSRICNRALLSVIPPACAISDRRDIESALLKFHREGTHPQVRQMPDSRTAVTRDLPTGQNHHREVLIFPVLIFPVLRPIPPPMLKRHIGHSAPKTPRMGFVGFLFMARRPRGDAFRDLSVPPATVE